MYPLKIECNLYVTVSNLDKGENRKYLRQQIVFLRDCCTIEYSKINYKEKTFLKLVSTHSFNYQKGVTK